MKFIAWSMFIMMALYGLVFAFGDAALMHAGAPLWADIAFAVAIIAIQFALAPWLIRSFLSIEFDDPDYPARQRQFIERMCHERNLPVPQLGLIHSGTPNAFAYGHFRSNARLVITSGLVDILSEDELNAVLAHELGHIAHYDFAVMGVASLAPLLLYQIYIWADRISNLKVLSLGAYAAYWAGQLMVLQLNRFREYFADEYSACMTQAPSSLASALVKIGYGLVKEEGEFQRSQKESSADKSRHAREHRWGGAMALMGISNLRAGSGLALAAADPQQASAIMQWDLKNPWARVYELSSTHPLTARRILALNRHAEAAHQTVQYPVVRSEVPSTSLWLQFPLQFVFWIMPFACALYLGLSLSYHEWLSAAHVTPIAEGPLLIALGVSWAGRIAFRYRGEFRHATIGELLQDIEASQMQPRAAVLRGEIVGRGVPGAFWSPDLVLRDATGMLFVLNRQSIPFARFFFAVEKADNFIGQQVTVTGWYRRALNPYIEISRMEAEIDGKQKVVRSYSRWIQLALAAIATAAGCVLTWR